MNPTTTNETAPPPVTVMAAAVPAPKKSKKGKVVSGTAAAAARTTAAAAIDDGGSDGGGSRSHKGQNVILHLKCRMCDLIEYQKIVKKFETNTFIYEPIVPNENYISYDDTIDHQYSTFYNNDSGVTMMESVGDIGSQPSYHPQQMEYDDIPPLHSHSHASPPTTIPNQHAICLKLKDLKLQLHKNAPKDKKSACFWCSFDYQTPLFYIPKHIINDVIYGYGSFCSPQCAVAYLIKDNIDDTTRYERYYLLNYLYGGDDGKSIKPAPNPYYMLNKYYGNLSIEEYRALIKTNHLYTIVEKPMTRIFPEIHEENEELLMGGSRDAMVVPTGTKHGGGGGAAKNNNRIYKVKMQNDPPPPSPQVANMTLPTHGGGETNKIDPFPFLSRRTTTALR